MTLPRFFAATVGVLAALAGFVLILAIAVAGKAIIQTGEAARAARASQVATGVGNDLGVAERAIEDFEQTLASGIVDAGDRVSVEHTLIAELIALRNLTDLTFTAGTLDGYDDDGRPLLAPDGRWQVSSFRESGGSLGRQVVDGFAPGDARDPTRHDTFQTAANRDFRGRALWSDVAFSELDGKLRQDSRRKTMTVQKAIFASTPKGPRFVGVLRAGLVSETLDRIGAPGPAGDPHQIFICDTAGRLVTRLGPQDRYQLVDQNGRPDPDGDLRVVPAVALPAPLAAALAFARERDSGPGGRSGKRMVVAGRPYYLTLLPVAEGRTQGWQVGVVVPESYYVGSLSAARSRLLVLLVAVVLAIAIVGAFGARTVGRGLHALVRSTEAMRRFSFDATVAEAKSPFAEIGAALESVERAKTALRAMVKYVPIDLVRRLYESGRDPVLGAEVSEISVMFTDIADFTTHAEALSPDALAEALGRYLKVATGAVEATGGTVDKYIGDALMVLWNAPTIDARHPASACRAALACAAATRALGTSSWWHEAGLSPWRTRFGIHTDRVLVGNFGAPDRLSYTAMGDGVNLAARLEGLNKVYGTTILVSEETRERAGDGFLFREVDRVAVKGKKRAVIVYELVGEAGSPDVEALRAPRARYEAALAATLARQFEDALQILAELPDDPVAAVLAARCRGWITVPPSGDWDGTWTATSK